MACFWRVAPTTNHTLMKIELLAKEWEAHAFTHFRPGLPDRTGISKAEATRRAGDRLHYFGRAL